MERITIVNRTTKGKGVVKLRFRLRDKGDVDLFYRSEIEVTIDELNRLGADGAKKRGCYLVADELLKQIQEEKQIIQVAYKQMIDEGLDKVSANLEHTIKRIKYPEKPKEEVVELLASLTKFAEQCYRSGRFSNIRYRQYKVMQRQLERYLIINKKKSIQPQQFTAKDVMSFREFLYDEYKSVGEYPFLYEGIKDRHIPRKRRSDTTVAATLKRLKAYYKEMEDTDKIMKSPFKCLSSADKRLSLKESIGAMTGLKQSEIKIIQNQSVPSELKEVKDAFLLQCYIGCRVADFASMTMDRVVCSDDGIPYLHYLPSKERKSNKTIDAPLIPSAIEIVNKYKFKFKILKNINGQKGYNKMIKKLLEYCGINRKIDNPLTGEFLPLYELASSKTARKTYVTLQVEHQPDPYILGLHRYGSASVNNYLSNTMSFKYMLVCAMFDEVEKGNEYLNGARKMSMMILQ